MSSVTWYLRGLESLPGNDNRQCPSHHFVIEWDTTPLGTVHINPEEIISLLCDVLLKNKERIRALCFPGLMALPEQTRKPMPKT